MVWPATLTLTLTLTPTPTLTRTSTLTLILTPAPTLTLTLTSSLLPHQVPSPSDVHGVGLKFHDGTFYFNTSTVLSTFKSLSATS